MNTSPKKIPVSSKVVHHHPGVGTGVDEETLIEKEMKFYLDWINESAYHRRSVYADYDIEPKELPSFWRLVPVVLYLCSIVSSMVWVVALGGAQNDFRGFCVLFATLKYSLLGSVREDQLDLNLNEENILEYHGHATLNASSTVVSSMTTRKVVSFGSHHQTTGIVLSVSTLSPNFTSLWPTTQILAPSSSNYSNTSRAITNTATIKNGLFFSTTPLPIVRDNSLSSAPNFDKRRAARDILYPFEAVSINEGSMPNFKNLYQKYRKRDSTISSSPKKAPKFAYLNGEGENEEEDLEVEHIHPSPLRNKKRPPVPISSLLTRKPLVRGYNMSAGRSFVARPGNKTRVYGFREMGSGFDPNHVDHYVSIASIDYIYSSWGPVCICNFALYVGVSSLFYAFLCCMFFSLCQMGRQQYAMLEHPSRLVLPSLLLSFIFSLLTVVSSWMISKGVDLWCKGIEDGPLNHCDEVQKYVWINNDKHIMNSRKAGTFFSFLQVANVASWLTSIFWIGTTLILMVRFFGAIDFYKEPNVYSPVTRPSQPYPPDDEVSLEPSGDSKKQSGQKGLTIPNSESTNFEKTSPNLSPSKDSATGKTPQDPSQMAQYFETLPDRISERNLPLSQELKNSPNNKKLLLADHAQPEKLSGDLPSKTKGNTAKTLKNNNNMGSDDDYEDVVTHTPSDIYTNP